MGKEKKVKTGGGGFKAPKTSVQVVKADAKGDQVVCSFTARQTTGGGRKSLTKGVDKITQTFQCDSTEHAKALAEHAPKLHARNSRHGLVYSLKKLAEGITLEDGTEVSGEILLRKARVRAAKNYAARQKVKEEKAKRRRLDDEHRVKMERKKAAA